MRPHRIFLLIQAPSGMPRKKAKKDAIGRRKSRISINVILTSLPFLPRLKDVPKAQAEKQGDAEK